MPLGVSWRVPRLTVALVAAAAVLTAACGQSTPSSPSGTAQVTVTDLVVGTGVEAAVFRTLVVNYTGWVYDASQPDGKGAQVDTTSGGPPYTFVLGVGAVIQGWDAGLPGMKVGGKRRLVIPPELAYGAAGQGAVPPNATLVFDIELLGVS
jgi:FKBP-type peptidyl-prolyl cis-trans isomerase FkpA